ncbi:MAG: DUF4097 family beta strand repeat protein [Anaerolineaceae bacterium]|nr:DUF4097 family beta strand repeat protein [Anaerolineaceae bacterium]
MSSNTKKLIIMVIVILIVAILTSSLCGLSSLGLGWLQSKKSQSPNTWTMKDNFSGISVKSQTGNVRFYKTNERSAKINWSGSRSTKLSVRELGGTLTVEETYNLPWFLRIGIHTEKTEIKIFLPRDEYRKLTVRTDTGSIEVPSAFSFDRAVIKTDTGAVSFLADVSKELKIDTDTGRISAGNIAAEKAEIKSDTGSVTVSDMKVSKDIRLKTDTGRIEMANIFCQDLDVSSDTGSLTLTNVIAADKLEAESDTGSIKLERCDAYGKLELETDTGSISGTLLSGKVFKARSGTGKVSVPESSGGAVCTIKSDTGSITIEIAGK